MVNNKTFAIIKPDAIKNNYIGFSITQGNVYRKKEWSMENIVKISSKLVENKKTPIFFIEKKDQKLNKKKEKFNVYK